jgi:hypothetical protein
VRFFRGTFCAEEARAANTAAARPAHRATEEELIGELLPFR